MTRGTIQKAIRSLLVEMAEADHVALVGVAEAFEG
jgi:hypothetical protein